MNKIIYRSLKSVFFGNYSQAQNILQKVLISVRDNPKVIH